MKNLILILKLFLYTINSIKACDCVCLDECSFSAIAENTEFIALVKALSYDDYLEDDIMGPEYNLRI